MAFLLALPFRRKLHRCSPIDGLLTSKRSAPTIVFSFSVKKHVDDLLPAHAAASGSGVCPVAGISDCSYVSGVTSSMEPFRRLFLCIRRSVRNSESFKLIDMSCNPFRRRLIGAALEPLLPVWDPKLIMFTMLVTGPSTFGLRCRPLSRTCLSTEMSI